MRREKYLHPQARIDGIIVKECDDEVLIYDRVRDKAHCLNPLASAIWGLCDGEMSPSEIAFALREKHGAHIDERIVGLGLEELRRSHLLELSRDTNPWPQIEGVSRREALRRIGLSAAITLPLVASLAVPTAQAATSCKSRCNPCSTGECCSGVCGNSGVTGCSGSGNKCL